MFLKRSVCCWKWDFYGLERCLNGNYNNFKFYKEYRKMLKLYKLIRNYLILYFEINDFLCINLWWCIVVGMLMLVCCLGYFGFVKEVKWFIVLLCIISLCSM